MRHFLITLTTQSPFDFLPRQYGIQSSSNDGELSKYSNSMKYLDNSLEDDYDKIVSVRLTTLYGEHGSGFRQEGAGCS